MIGRLCFDLAISWCHRQILCLAWTTFAVRNTRQILKPWAAVDLELKPDHPIPSIFLTLPLPATLFFISFFTPSLSSFPLVLSALKTHLWKWRVTRSKFVTACFNNSGLAEIPVWPIRYVTAPLHFLCTLAKGKLGGCWVKLNVTLFDAVLMLSHFIGFLPSSHLFCSSGIKQHPPWENRQTEYLSNRVWPGAVRWHHRRLWDWKLWYAWPPASAAGSLISS